MTGSKAYGLPALTGAVALVTGGASGIGAAAVRRLAAAGARVVVADRDLAAAEAVAGEVGGRALVCDVTDATASERAVALAEQVYGGLDAVLLNAGITAGTSSWDDLDPARYREVVAINVDGVVFGLRAALPALRRRGRGSMVVTSSLAGLTATPATPLYSLTKHAVVGLVRSMAAPLATEGISLNAVCPGFTQTPLLGNAFVQRFEEAGYPLLTADDVAVAALGLLTGDGIGQCLVCQPGREPQPYAFRGVPGARGGAPGALPPTRLPLPDRARHADPP